LGNFSEAVRAMREAEAVCPVCQAKNARGQHVIKIDLHHCAWCSKCGHEWDVKPEGQS